MVKVTRRLGRLSGAIAAGVAIIATGSGVMAASYSTFSATTASPTNAWSSGSLTLTNDSPGANSAMFTASTSALSGTKCIKVSSGGTYAGVVKLFSTGFTDTSSLGSHINLVVDVGAASGNGSFADCTGFTQSYTVYNGTLQALGTANTSYSSGLQTASASTSWTTTAGTADYRVFRFAWTYDSTAPQGATAGATFTWSALSN